MSFLLPAVCSTFKGISPSTFAERWGDPEVGLARMEIDACVASEINDQLSEAYSKSDKSNKNLAKDAKGAVARRNQRRAARMKKEGGD
tara:strand:+ start:8019 stop:8282 length:264 start_codon:yes stop_codon:yes gene_type:complete